MGQVRQLHSHRGHAGAAGGRGVERLALVRAARGRGRVGRVRAGDEGAGREQRHARQGADRHADPEPRPHRVRGHGGAARGQGQPRGERPAGRALAAAVGDRQVRSRGIHAAGARAPGRRAARREEPRRGAEGAGRRGTAAHQTAFADRRGDVLLAQGKPAEARSAWQQALDKADPQHPLRQLIQLKLDSVRRGGVVMRGRRVGGVVAAVLAMALVVGCASKSNTAKPADLVEFKPTLTLRTAWRVSVGDGRGAPLQPAVLENAVYAAGASGTLMRVAPASGEVVWRWTPTHG